MRRWSPKQTKQGEALLACVCHIMQETAANTLESVYYCRMSHPSALVVLRMSKWKRLFLRVFFLNPSTKAIMCIIEKDLMTHQRPRHPKHELAGQPWGKAAEWEEPGAASPMGDLLAYLLHFCVSTETTISALMSPHSGLNFTAANPNHQPF